MSGEDSNSHTGLEIGRTLRRAREKRGLSLQQVEEATKIRSRYLRDLENENFDVLPAVYMLGSLKTYAEHLGLDGAAITRELKRRQASMQAEQTQAPENPTSGEPRGLLASLGRLVGIGEAVEDEAGAMAPVHRPGLYVSLVVVVVFVLATYFASSIRGEDQPSVSVVREPTISQVPSGIALVGDREADESNAKYVSEENKPEKQAASPATDAGNDEKARTARSGYQKYAPPTAQASSSSATAYASASASASADVSASASPASTGSSTGSTSAPTTLTPEPTRVRPEPEASEQPHDAGREMVAAPTDNPSARASGGLDPNPAFQRNQTSAVDSTLPGNSVSTEVKKTVNYTP